MAKGRRRGAKGQRGAPGRREAPPERRAEPRSKDDVAALDVAPAALPRGVELATWVLPALAAVIGGAVFYGFTCDDAYITVRYADHLLRGEGLVFNPGERVEGFSSPLHLLLLSVVGVLGVALIEAAKVLGLAAAAVAAACTVALARRLGAAPLVAGAVGLAVGLHPGVLYYASSGMETTLYLALVAGAALRLAIELTGPQSPAPGARRPVSLWLLGAAAVTRPEGALLLAVACAARLWRARPGGGRALAAEVLRSLVAWLPLACWLAFRLAYYGEWLPNVYYAKPSGLGLGLDGVGAGLVYLHEAIMGGGTYLALGAALAALALPGLRPRAPIAMVLLLAGAQGAFAVHTTGDWMLEARYALPAVPLMLAAAAAGLTAIAVRRRALRPVVALACAALVIALGARAVTLAGELEGDRAHDHAHRSDGNEALGRWLAAHTPEDAVVVADEIGAVAHYSDRHVIDTLGLVDPEIARILHRHAMNPYSHATELRARIEATAEVAEAVLRREPDVVLLDYEGPVADESTYDPRFINIGARFLYQRFDGAYRFRRAHVISTRAFPPKAYLIFERDDSATSGG